MKGSDPVPSVLSPEVSRTAGILLLTLVAVEFGGTFMLRLVRGTEPVTAFQQAFYRAGHAHAGVLVVLSLVSQLLVGLSGLTGVLAVLSNGVWLAAILMPAGFFLSAAGRGRTRPSQLIWLVYAGATLLAVGVVSLGLGLLGVSA
jgi:hypothetical protein